MFAWLTRHNRKSNRDNTEAVTVEKKLEYEATISMFETIWIAEHVDGKHYPEKALSDDDYIKYHQWEAIHWESMYRRHLPHTMVCRGVNPNIIFHGGCIGCTMQQLHGIDTCKGCSYFKSNGNFPNLNNDDFLRFNQ